MKILQTTTNLIDCGSHYEILGDLRSRESLELTDLHKPLHVGGSVISSGYLKIDESIKVNGYIDVGEYIKVNGYLEASEHIEVIECIEVDSHIYAGGHIKAGECIWTGEAGDIYAGFEITALGTITFGGRVRAGQCPSSSIKNAERVITCTELIGSGLIECSDVVYLTNENE